MSWLRLDDGFADHPKVLELARADRWRWVELLTLVARYRTAGHVRPGMLRGADIGPKLTAKLVELHLLDAHELDGHQDYSVHDWADYNPPADPTGRDRQARHRARQRQAKDLPQRETIRPQQPPVTPQQPSGIDPERNALPVTVQPLPPVPVPQVTVGSGPHNRTPTRPDDSADSGPETVADEAAAALARLRRMAGDPPSWAPDDLDDAA